MNFSESKLEKAQGSCQQNGSVFTSAECKHHKPFMVIKLLDMNQ